MRAARWLICQAAGHRFDAAIWRIPVGDRLYEILRYQVCDRCEKRVGHAKTATPDRAAVTVRPAPTKRSPLRRWP